MLHPDELAGALPSRSSANDTQVASKARHSGVEPEPLTREVPARHQRACLETSAGQVQWEWNLDRQEIAVFARTRAGSDATAPAFVCSFDEWLECVVGPDRQRVRAKLFSLAANATRSFEAQFRVISPAGRLQWADLCGVAVRDEQAKLIRIVAQQRMIAGARDGKQSALPSPFHDPLTGLPNRSLFHRCLSDALECALRDVASRIAILFVDLDEFKKINDRHGHLVGDETLVAEARRLAHCLRPEDVLARRDGDEFTILAKNVEQQAAAEAIAERVLQHLLAAGVEWHGFGCHRERRSRVGAALHPARPTIFCIAPTRRCIGRSARWKCI